MSTADIVITAMYVLLFGGFVLSVRVLLCNETTFKERTKLIELVFTDPARFLPAYDKVSYRQHMWALVFLRDPLKLYPEELRQAASNV